MKDIKNTTRRPISVPLPRGGKLHLGPLQNGEVAAAALDHPPFMKLVESGEIEILGEGDHNLPHPIKKQAPHAESHGHSPVAIKPSGER